MNKLNINVSSSWGNIIFTPEGRIDSTNAKDFNNSVMSYRNSKPEASVIFDCSELQYISSAGLRVLLSLTKKEKTPVRLINVPPAIMDILEVTGFSQILDVEAASQGTTIQGIKDISDEPAALMGESGGVAVYRMNNDMILKLSPAGAKLEDVEAELKYSKAALLCGVPALISYDAITYNGRYGVRYEMPNAKTVSSLISFQQWKLDRHASEMGKTLRHIHTCRPEQGVLPRTADIYTGFARKMEKYLGYMETERLISLINTIPEADTFVYGNYHSGNVFVQDDELILINMSGVSTGNPVFDLGMSYMIYVLEAEWLSKRLTGLEVMQARKFWNVMIRSYLGTNNDSTVQQYETSIKACALLCSAIFPAMSTLSRDDTARLVGNARKKLLADYDTFTNPVYNAVFSALSGANFEEDI